mmetsp:Transcript_13766/g.22578  ORF Transcript_13766/g.22578 Transcript_13766/m.22578 type:complete len:89 (+) Transcript_13766:233-499(+)
MTKESTKPKLLHRYMVPKNNFKIYELGAVTESLEEIVRDKLPATICPQQFSENMPREFHCPTITLVADLYNDRTVLLFPLLQTHKVKD